MKKSTLLLLAMLIHALIASSQSSIYHPFPTSNAFWGIDGMNIFDLRCLNSRYGLNGDTLINNKLYQKVFSLADSTLSNPASEYFAAIREEDKRIYCLINDAPEELLYDFNAEVGDTLYWHYSLAFHAPEEFARVVSAIDSIRLYNGEYRKRFFLEPAGFNSMADVVVEGIGSIVWQGLFNPLINTAATNGDTYSLSCFKQDEEVIFLDNPNCDHCFCSLLTGISPPINAEGFSILPNPAHRFFTLTIPVGIQSYDASLYNISGQLIMSWVSLTGSSNVLDCVNIRSGCYLLEISKGGRKMNTLKLLLK